MLRRGEPHGVPDDELGHDLLRPSRLARNIGGRRARGHGAEGKHRMHEQSSAGSEPAANPLFARRHNPIDASDASGTIAATPPCACRWRTGWPTSGSFSTRSSAGRPVTRAIADGSIVTTFAPGSA